MTTRTRDGWQVEATDGTHTKRGAGLGVLDRLGVTVGEGYRTLVVADRTAVAHLADLAVRDHDAASAPVVAWWDQRADHAGTGAVHVVTEAARARFVTGHGPGAEQGVEMWKAAFAIPAPGAPGLLDLARVTSGGPVLPELVNMSASDSRSWAYHRERLDTGWAWRRADSRRQAALGLATRCDAAELYASMRLGDPGVAVRSSHEGTVISGQIVGLGRGVVELVADRPVCRLRVGARVAGWIGDPAQTLTSERRLRSGVVAATRMDADATLTVVVEDTTWAGRSYTQLGVTAGEPMTLRPAPVSAPAQTRHRKELAFRYELHDNWVSAARTPTTRAFDDVPLDVIMAAAAAEEGTP
jgi:hypothetical protein